jgi:hypothetical protein
MTPVQLWAMVLAVMVIALVIRDAVKKTQCGRLPGPESRRAYRPADVPAGWDFTRFEQSRPRQQGRGYVPEGGPGLLRSYRLIAAIARSGYKGDFWKRNRTMIMRALLPVPARAKTVNRRPETENLFYEKRRWLYVFPSRN